MTVVLVAGVARSGSTMLDLILGNRPDAFSCGEIYAWYRPFRPHHLTPVCGCGAPIGECPVWAEVGRPRARELHAHVARVTGTSTIVDSSKDLAWIADVARWNRRRPTVSARVVLAWRHPREVAHSYWKRGDDGWADHLLGYVDRLDRLGLPYLVVPIDRLADDPPEVLSALHHHLGGAYQPGQEEFWNGRYHQLFGSGGTASQVGRPSSLASPSLPDEVVARWEALPSKQRERVEALDARMRRGGPVGLEVPRSRPLGSLPWRAAARLRTARASRAVRTRVRAAS